MNDERRKKHARSSLSNGLEHGRLFPHTIDGRSIIARRFKDLVYDIATDLGGVSELSTAELQLVRRGSMLGTLSEQLEAKAASAKEGHDLSREDLDRYLAMTNAIRRVFEAIGIKRRPRDVSPTLQHYLEALPDRAGQLQAAEEPSGEPGVQAADRGEPVPLEADK